MMEKNNSKLMENILKKIDTEIDLIKQRCDESKKSNQKVMERIKNYRTKLTTKRYLGMDEAIEFLCDLIEEIRFNAITNEGHVKNIEFASDRLESCKKEMEKLK